ncbi:hypothetical protein H8356DRAFT_1052084 [Neocallimastix lanati (nom. inval.)]|jgi:uncharacterized protein YigA (DUF484 family)|uniref:Uncharacterized protein n=1 Tax=Neocallimastix californiae TaxID=1754190 RepID=A0A1Y2DJH0_9FUNG|nr:hypothetical protein H8356DRAFT_1052084 [Neocallimastix sp. JGI-2020a]ORY59372.1 hypothetical protein LY90DRAFT_668863 [Neocallimastix californiae]|eukprot:ORY59372.1 hypothetical protein LY90DRAFT_668863 [Neocallimastix californiae]
MTSTLKSPTSLKIQRKGSHYYSYLARKKRSYEEETFEILTDNYRKNKRFITEIMVQQFSLLTVSKSDKVRHLRQETTNKMNHGEYRLRRKSPKIKTFSTILNSPLSQPPIILSFGNSESQETSTNTKFSKVEKEKENSLRNTGDEEDSVMSDVPLSPTAVTLEASMEEHI